MGWLIVNVITCFASATGPGALCRAPVCPGVGQSIATPARWRPVARQCGNSPPPISADCDVGMDGDRQHFTLCPHLVTQPLPQRKPRCLFPSPLFHDVALEENSDLDQAPLSINDLPQMSLSAMSALSHCSEAGHRGATLAARVCPRGRAAQPDRHHAHEHRGA
jgi:hypothetical protein